MVYTIWEDTALKYKVKLPQFTENQFTATEWATAKEKARMANMFARFIADGCPAEKFTQPLYKRLSMMFGHIAHYNCEGFRATWFSNPAQVNLFIEHLTNAGCYGQPEYTWCDVEKALKSWVVSTGLHDQIRQDANLFVQDRAASWADHLLSMLPEERRNNIIAKHQNVLCCND